MSGGGSNDRPDPPHPHYLVHDDSGRIPAFERRSNGANRRRQEDAAAKKIAWLEAKLQKKNEVVAELLEEHVQLKKELGEP